MQEEVTQKTIALSMKTGKLTAQALQAALKKYLQHRAKGPKLHHGRQSLKQLKAHGAALTNIEVTEANIGAFKPCAKKYGVDFTLRKDKTTQPPHYIVIFKAKDADNLEQAFREFTAKTLSKEQRPSILIDGITGNLSGLFDNVNAKVGEIASDVGSTPQAWNSGIFNMLRSLSETVVLPIAAAILALVMCHELIQMITEKNNMHDFDTSMFFRWIFKSAFAILIVSNTWNIVMGVFDATQSVVNQSSGVIIGETSIHFDRLIPGLEFQLESMTIGSLLSLWFQTLVVGLTMNILSICIFLVTYGRMIEIYVVTALGPIPLATMGSSEWRSTGQNYLKSLLALGFQAFLIMIVVGIYAVLIRNISGAADIAGAIWGCMGYTVLLCFCLFKTGSISKSVFGAH